MNAAHYKSLKQPEPIAELEFNDTFLSLEHLIESFPEYEIETSQCLKPPFRLTFCDLIPKNTSKKIIVKPGKLINRGPYSFEQPKLNQVKFTATQVEAIKSGMQPGLTIVVGPPGTGKTDVAVQIISNIYQNFPDQKTIIVTHSNQALNQLFEKLICLDIDERHLLRLGHGEEMLDTEKDFSRYGRVNYVLAKRLQLLDEVDRLQNSFEDGFFETASYSCETAKNFYLNFVLPKWKLFNVKIKEKCNNSVETLFPFSKFFSNAEIQPLFKKVNFDEDVQIAKGIFYFYK